LKNGRISTGQGIAQIHESGMRVDIQTQKPGEDQPMIFTFNFSLDTLKFKEFLKKHEYLTKSLFSFSAFGIQVNNHRGLEKWEQTAFVILDKEGRPITLPLIQRDVTITVHRDIFSGQEWLVYLQQRVQNAAQTDR